MVLNGWGVGESHHGGLAQRARVKGDWLVKLPDAITTRQAMAIGTAGYTAMLAVMALERNGLTPARGDVLVTGAAGGVGGVAIALLDRLGYRVIASSGRKAEQAATFKTSAPPRSSTARSWPQPGRPIGKERWAGAIDSVGSHTLANVLGSDALRRSGRGLRPRPGHGPAGRVSRRSSCAGSRWPASTR